MPNQKGLVYLSMRLVGMESNPHLFLGDGWEMEYLLRGNVLVDLGTCSGLPVVTVSQGF